MVQDACNTGYQGFQGFSLRPPPVLKPGETLDSRRSKFLTAGDALNGATTRACEMRDATVSSMMSHGLTLSDYHVPDRRGVSAIFCDAMPPVKPCAGTTMSRHSYGRNKMKVTALEALRPEWLFTMSTDSVVARQMKSSYQMDLGMAGETPASRPFVAKAGMASTTMDLCEGTAKATYHIPGYSGHIPCSTRNPTVADHANGASSRPQRSNLRLYHRHNLPGYTGHNPSTAKNDKGPRFSGSNPLTSSGAMVNGEVL